MWAQNKKGFQIAPWNRQVEDNVVHGKNMGLGWNAESHLCLAGSGTLGGVSRLSYLLCKAVKMSRSWLQDVRDAHQWRPMLIFIPKSRKEQIRSPTDFHQLPMKILASVLHGPFTLWSRIFPQSHTTPHFTDEKTPDTDLLKFQVHTLSGETPSLQKTM